MHLRDKKRATDTKLWERTEEIIREIGTLFMAFAPLDAVLGDNRLRWKWMLFFFVLGILLIVVALVSEKWRKDAA